jgi:3-oxoacyl-ACP reductase-like protein
VGAHTSFEFKLAAKDVHQKLNDSIHRREGVREQEETDHNGLLAVEAERLVERIIVHESREESEDVEHVKL